MLIIESQSREKNAYQFKDIHTKNIKNPERNQDIWYRPSEGGRIQKNMRYLNQTFLLYLNF